LIKIENKSKLFFILTPFTIDNWACGEMKKGRKMFAYKKYRSKEKQR